MKAFDFVSAHHVLRFVLLVSRVLLCRAQSVIWYHVVLRATCVSQGSIDSKLFDAMSWIFQAQQQDSRCLE